MYASIRKYLLRDLLRETQFRIVKKYFISLSKLIFDNLHFITLNELIPNTNLIPKLIYFF